MIFYLQGEGKDKTQRHIRPQYNERQEQTIQAVTKHRRRPEQHQKNRK